MTGFLSFAELCKKVEKASGSLDKIDLVAAFLAGLSDDELSIASNFIMGAVFSQSSGLVLGVGPSILYEAMAKACGCSGETILQMLRATGDPGLVAAGVAEKRRPLGLASFGGMEPISIQDVQRRFLAVARASGKKSQDSKVKNLQFLFSQSTPLEAQYIARLAIEDMRIGVGEGGVRDAIAKAFSRSAEAVERGYNLTNDMGRVAVSARRGTLEELCVMLNHPIKMMLASLGDGIPAA
ncbi:MAG: DNA ligase, partial [Methanothrix sp.]|nr:DNA ligase [Methanothrix sp.]